ncbi:MAG: hypothetical protein CO113_15505 [Elusimicrobia bacterium CG_4_9_14_3_um_filter_62_55]|nr:MAG: hypothetical protein COR54_16425 [Elusimicrobia bacterium CG22_combo_CG10-13_8_21_14_all_63_91]PJB24139.1 MAG: hypothetical protein CO113_15505 [Elusimicrobia bacterium CG_4_9_14_3_um_filter_62_55]
MKVLGLNEYYRDIPCIQNSQLPNTVRSQVRQIDNSKFAGPKMVDHLHEPIRMVPIHIADWIESGGLDAGFDGAAIPSLVHGLPFLLIGCYYDEAIS